MPISIVTDSTCDIPHNLAEKLNIHIVPNILVINGRSIEDDQNFSRQAFYQQLPDMNPLPTTATASSGAYHRLYTQLLEKSTHEIISIHASSLLSGIFNAASLAAQSFNSQVHVIDSQQVSLGLGFQVIEAAEAVLKEMSYEMILRQIENSRSRVRLVAMLDTLEYIRRSGRVSWVRARLGSLLRIKPFVQVKEGMVESLGEVRTRKKGVERLLYYLGELNPFERLAILHSNAESDAYQLLADLNPDTQTQPIIVNVTTVIGTHVGPNGLGFAAVTT